MTIYPQGVYRTNMRRASRTLSARIHKLTGQLQAIETMIMDKRACAEVLNQISAVRAGLENVAVIVFQKELQRLAAKKSLTLNDVQRLSETFSKTT